MHGVQLEDLTWLEAKAWFDQGRVVVIPIGAIAKEHGHHLPLKTDWLIARELGRRVAEALPVVVAPVLSMGYYPAFVRYPGSQHLSAPTFTAVLTETFAKFRRDGVRHMAVINTGVSTEAPLRVAVRDFYEATGQRVYTADIRTLGRRGAAGLDQKLGGHGDEGETSMILAIAPETVRMGRAVTDYGHQLDLPLTCFYEPTVFDGDPASGADYSVSGVRGDPTLATAEKGRVILDSMTEDLIQGLRALFPAALAG
jgi:creatinine amidohydrolase